MLVLIGNDLLHQLPIVREFIEKEVLHLSDHEKSQKVFDDVNCAGTQNDDKVANDGNEITNQGLEQARQVSIPPPSELVLVIQSKFHL